MKSSPYLLQREKAEQQQRHILEWLLAQFSGNSTNSHSNMCLEACLQVGGIAQKPKLQQ